MIGPGAPIDTDRYFVVCPNVLGGCRGTTGPSSAAPDGRPWGSRFPRITIRDQVAAEVLLADQLGIERWAGVVGGSMGGMRVLEWCVGHPGRVGRAGRAGRRRGRLRRAGGAVLGAVPGHPTRSRLRRRGLLRHRIDPGRRHGGRPGDRADLATAPRRSWPSGSGVRPRATRTRSSVEPSPSSPISQYQGQKLAARFDANSYLVLSEAMNRHDVGRDRGGVAAALSRVTAEVRVGGIDSDRLYPLALQAELAELLPGDHSLTVVHSVFGHDGFLLEIGQVGAVVARALAD